MTPASTTNLTSGNEQPAVGKRFVSLAKAMASACHRPRQISSRCLLRACVSAFLFSFSVVPSPFLIFSAQILLRVLLVWDSRSFNTPFPRCGSMRVCIVCMHVMYVQLQTSTTSSTVRTQVRTRVRTVRTYVVLEPMYVHGTSGRTKERRNEGTRERPARPARPERERMNGTER